MIRLLIYFLFCFISSVLLYTSYDQRFAIIYSNILICVMFSYAFETDKKLNKILDRLDD